ncbi:hypothetical protein EVAR_14232_1 [Eumeta japonica]|uniref:Uncharacterized protein n=1 Tax=Eumeta variegata TaxID=151549 RepID=A0A4C1WB50_EUMVA|nr:hypothetical protein EVAR_14232_1 [Eumeta japonica]
MPESRVPSMQTSSPEAALTKKMAADYDWFPLSHAKKMIRAASLEELQNRYAEGSTGEIIKCFFPQVEEAYRILRKIEMTSQMAQTLMSHDEFVQYLYRFNLQDSPHWACDLVKRSRRAARSRRTAICSFGSVRR